ncbi:MAG: oligosaccharide flippase family protein [Bifidobacterium aquikefiri]|uniref:Polysaccharide biosynthesis protein n=1 Tax=Bifidobacterium aquikefiri TaxID=1653207 RepID=A0A261G970_9BIFI|nr:oligosaccharide flippase family protein [Bifidobacterium aquikefiri]OZG67763.1 polysaccharide biosynthesis protein [Bifidobacterium aquikefiri]
MRRGLVLNLIGNVVFFLTSYGIHYYLGSTMPAASYGIVGTIMTVLDFEYMFLSNGARQSLAKEISMRRFDVGDVIRKSLLFQLLLILAFFCINFFGAPVFSYILNDPTLAIYFRIAAFLVPANGLFVLLLGLSDGIQRFSTSALLSTIYPIAKLSVIPLIIFFFQKDPVAGMEVGYLLALIFSIGLGCILMFRYRKELKSFSSRVIPFRTIAHNTLSFSIFFIMVSLVLSIDTLIVKSVVKPASMAGYYTGAVNFGKLSYYLMTAFFTVILPVVAKAVGQNDVHGAVKQVKQFILLVLSFILPIPIVISASSASLLISFYHPAYAVAGTALSFLSLSSFFMGMTVMLNMVHTSFSSNRFSDALSICSLVIVVPIFILAAKFGGITHIALASMICTGIAMVISYLILARKTGNIITRNAIIAIVSNAILWVVVRLLFHVFNIEGLGIMALIYVVIYGLYITIMLATHVVVIPKDLLNMIRKRGGRKNSEEAVH